MVGRCFARPGLDNVEALQDVFVARLTGETEFLCAPTKKRGESLLRAGKTTGRKGKATCTRQQTMASTTRKEQDGLKNLLLGEVRVFWRSYKKFELDVGPRINSRTFPSLLEDRPIVSPISSDLILFGCSVSRIEVQFGQEPTTHAGPRCADLLHGCKASPTRNDRYS